MAAAAAWAGAYDYAERIARSITSPDEQARALVGMAGSVAEPGRARSCIAGALAAGRWTIALKALARIDPVASLWARRERGIMAGYVRPVGQEVTP